MTKEASVECHIDGRGVANITMARPEVHNAFDDQLIGALSAAFCSVAGDETVRVVVLQGAGKSFSAGADLSWMRRMADYSEAENFEDAKKLAHMLDSISSCPKPVIARVHGPAFGGGVGLVAACDIAIGTNNAVFALSEVKLGLIPSVISPYVIRSMGERQASRYMVTGERFHAEEAHRIGLLHQITGSDDLDRAINNLITACLNNGPKAMREVKELIPAIASKPVDPELMNDTSKRIARVRASEEGREGISAFLEKRDPNWTR